MRSRKRLITYVIYILLGAALLGAGSAGVVDEYWSGMGSGLIVVAILGLIREFRFRKDEAYREKVEISMSDERNRFIRSKAWAWSGYLFILISGISGIILRIMGQELLSLAANYAVCLMLVLYWGSYVVLRKKY